MTQRAGLNSRQRRLARELSAEQDLLVPPEKPAQGPYVTAPRELRKDAGRGGWRRRTLPAGLPSLADMSTSLGAPRGLKDLQQEMPEQPLECPRHQGGHLLSGVQVTCAEETAIPTLPILHGMPKTVGGR